MKIVLTGGVWQRCQPGAGARAAPPLRVVGALAALVLLAHALVLGTSPRHIGPALAPAAPERVAAMSTRRIALAPPAPPATPAPTPPAPTPPASPAPATAPAPPAKPAAVVKPLAATPPQAQPHAQAALKKNPAPAQPAPAPLLGEAPAPLPDALAQDEMPQSSADRFTGVEDGSGRDGPATQATPEPPDASNTETGATPLASPPAAPPANPASPASPASPANPSPSPSQNLTTALPASVQLDYHITASWLSASGKAELLWHNSASRYDASMTLTLPFGARSMSSQGQVGAQGLAPSRFSDKFPSEVAAHFEPDKGLISFSANTPSVPWVQGAQDRLSVMMQLGGMLAGNPGAFPAGTSISVYTVGPRDAQSWTFRVEGEEMLSLPWGELTALKLSRQLRHEDDQQLDIWYAPALGYVPVRNKITQPNGDFVDQQLSAVTQP